MAEQWTAWLVYDRQGAERNSDYIRMHKEIGNKFGFNFDLKIIEEIYSRNEFSMDAILLNPDFSIVRTIRPDFTKELENRHIPVFNNAFVSEICNDKGKTIHYVEKHTDIPTVPTERFSNIDLTKKLLEHYPNHIIKAVDGHGGLQVFGTWEPYGRIVDGIGTSDFVIQPKIEGPGKDVRLYVVGDEIVGAVERTAKEGFRANYSLGADVCTYIPSKEDIQNVKELCRLFSFGLVGVDFLVCRDGRLLLNEIEDVVGARMLYRCHPDVGLLERYFAFIRDKLLREG